MRVEEKAASLYREIYRRFTVPGDFVVDFFAGTFTSALAALYTDRRYLGCEVDPECYALAIQRLHRITAISMAHEHAPLEEDVVPADWPNYICPPERSILDEKGHPEQKDENTAASSAEFASAQVQMWPPHRITRRFAG